MKIPTELALKIVKDMKNIINQNLNFIDIDGYIIASTNKKRIGTFHEASLKCITTKNEVIITNDNEYLGSKKGINIPVYLDNEIVGIIGITGEQKDVEKYGKIIKSMTEILIKEAQIKELAIKKREKNRNIIESILYNQNKNLEFYISLNFPYTVIVGKTDDKIEDNNILYKAIEDLLPKDKKSIFTITSNYIIIFLNSIKENYIENTKKFRLKLKVRF
jgi:carbohydrate diacid regulator